MRLTVGPLPPAVYWRRRAVVLGALLLVLFLLAQACMAASASPDRQPEATSTPTGPATPTPTSSPATPIPTPAQSIAVDAEPVQPPPDEGPVGDSCGDDEVLIIAEAAQTEVMVGASVQFEIRIRHDSGRTCSRDVGAGQRELYLRKGSGASRVWSSRDCAELTGRDVQQLASNFEAAAWVIWNGRASDTCDDQREPAGSLLEPGEYELVARLGTAYSSPVLITVIAAS